MPDGYDFTITHNGVTKGYMLARQGQLGRGQRAWQVETTGASIAQQMPTEQRYGNQPAVIEAPMVFKTCHRGYGDSHVRGEGRYHYALNMDCRFPDLVLPGPKRNALTLTDSAHHVTGFFEMDGMVFCIAGQRCYALKSDDTVVLAKDFGAGKEAVGCARSGAIALVGMGYSEPPWKRTSNADPTLGWTQGSGLYVGYLHRSRDRLYASASSSTVRWCDAAADPLNPDNWAASYAIGEAAHTITAIREFADLLYVGKEDGLYALPADGMAVCLSPELKDVPNAWNCHNMASWQGRLWVPHVRGLLQYQNLGANGHAVVPATPGAWTTDDNPIRGRVTALVGDNRWLYAAVKNPDGNSYLLAGRMAFEGEGGPLVWHPLADLGAVECRALHLSGLFTNPRLYYGQGYNVGYIILPRNGEDPVQDANCRYEMTGSLYYSAHNWFAPTTPKVWKSIEIGADGLAIARYLDVYYRIDGDVWKLAGRADRSPRDVIALPEGVTGTRIEVRLDHTLPSDSIPFRLTSVVVKGAERPRTMKVISATVRCADHVPTYAGTDRRTGAQILLDLEEYATSASAVTLVDPLGIERQVLVLPPIAEREEAQYGDEPPEMLATIQMAEFEPADRPTGYEVGVYGTDKYGQFAYA